jgi:hypothetical protein
LTIISSAAGRGMVLLPTLFARGAHPLIDPRHPPVLPIRPAAAPPSARHRLRSPTTPWDACSAAPAAAAPSAPPARGSATSCAADPAGPGRDGRAGPGREDRAEDAAPARTDRDG